MFILILVKGTLGLTNDDLGVDDQGLLTIFVYVEEAQHLT